MNLRICMLIARFYPEIGGTELQALRLSQALKARGINVFIVTQRLKNLKKFEEINGLKIHRLFSPGQGRFASFIFMLSSLMFLVRKRAEYDIIHVHLASSPAISACLAGRILNKKVVVKLGGARQTGDIVTSRKTFLGRIKLAFLRQYVDIFVYPSKEIEKELLNANFQLEKCKYMPNGVDIYQFSPVSINEKDKLRQQLGLPQTKIAIFVGRLETGKGMEWLLEVWGKIVKNIPQSSLIILGEGNMKYKLEKLAIIHKIENSVKFIGCQENVNVYLQAADVFVFPSEGEGLANSLLEAMACGLPIVATNIGGTNEIIINSKNGILVNFQDSQALMEHISSLFKDQSRAQELGQYARKTVEDNYSLENISQQYSDLYKNLLITQ